MELLDAIVLLTYVGLLLGIGWRAARHTHGASDLMLANRSMATWMVLCSMVATELSAATFIGVPQAAFVGDWSFLQLGVGALLAKWVIGRWLIPLYYRMRVTTVYGLLGARHGQATQTAAALAFVGGRLLASGARLFIAAQAVAVLAGVSIGPAIVLTGLVAGLYTVRGGIRAVIETDILQGAIFLVAISALLVGLFFHLGLDASALVDWAWQEDRMRVIHASPFFSLTDPRSLGTALIGGFALTLATHGTDHDMVQRLLTAHDGRSGGLALFRSGWLNFPISALFLATGTALAYAGHMNLLPPLAGSEQLIPAFARESLPAGLRGLVFVGLIAAAMSSLDSAICALSTTWVSDIGKKAHHADLSGAAAERRMRRVGIGFTVLLVASAWAMAGYWDHLQAQAQSAAGPLDLVQFALSAMSILYGGLLGVFILAWWFPSRGDSRSSIAALVVGGVVGAILFLQPFLFDDVLIAWPWWIPCSASLSFLVAGSMPARPLSS